MGHDVDRAQFIKLYINGVKAFRDLTSAGARVFEVLYLQMQANPGRDKITLSFLRIDQQITPMSEKTYHRGMRELLEKRFIAESVVPGDYFLNPDYLFNGDRLAFVQEFRLKSAPAGAAGVRQIEQPRESVTPANLLRGEGEASGKDTDDSAA